jgi:hypothetical protein
MLIALFALRHVETQIKWFRKTNREVLTNYWG